MTVEPTVTDEEPKKPEVRIQANASNPVYGIGIFGAWVYYIGRAKTFEEAVKGFFKGLFWPAFLVYELLVFLNKE